MLSVRVEKQLNKQKTNISNSLFWVLTIMYTIAYNSSWRAISWLWYGVSIIAILFLMLKIWQKGTVKLDFFTGWAILFFVYSLFSSLWAINIDPILDQIKTLSLIFAINILLAQIISTKQDVEKMLMSNIIALVVLLAYILFNTDVSKFGEFRLGVDTLGTHWNANDIGIKLCVGFAISLYFMLQKLNIKEKGLWALFSLLFLIVALFTGSRKVVLMIAGVIFLVFFIKAKKYRLLVAFVLCLLVVLFVVVTMKIPVLYDVLGVRMEDLIKGLMEKGAGDSSFSIRERMIELGFQWFQEKPLLGYGINNFRELYAAEGYYGTYSHNNFIEILVGGGLIGFFIYYSIYCYVIFKLIKPAFNKRNLLIISTLVINLMLLILQIAQVSYYETLNNCLLLLGTICVRIGERENEY